ncbi:MAG: hypothetical protein JRG73_19270 [Deltaproteobacteria bacterium]|nr:hypothetical protein [Deltaproteobacteria bacterium]
MAREKRTDDRRGTLKSFFIVFLMALAVAAWGGFIFVFIGDRGQPDWEYGTISDVPGKSPYSTQIQK